MSITDLVAYRLQYRTIKAVCGLNNVPNTDCMIEKVKLQVSNQLQQLACPIDNVPSVWGRPRTGV